MVALKKYQAFEDNSPPFTVESVENHLYFYSEVDVERCQILMKTLREQERILQTEKITRNIDFNIPIWLHLHSNGGDLFAAFAVADSIQQLKTPVYTVVEGFVASAATFIAMAGKKRYMLPNSIILIHQLSSIFVGKYDEFKDELNLQEKATQYMVKFYAQHSKLTEEELNEKLKRNFYLCAEEALELGFVDEILNG